MTRKMDKLYTYLFVASDRYLIRRNGKCCELERMCYTVAICDQSRVEKSGSSMLTRVLVIMWL